MIGNFIVAILVFGAMLAVAVFGYNKSVKDAERLGSRPNPAPGHPQTGPQA